MKTNLLLFLLVASSFSCFAQELTATQKLPKEISPASSFTVELTINKGTLTGFIKFAQVLPVGFVAEDIDSKSGSFSFGPDGIRVIWMTPPADAAFTISYKVTAPAEISGNTITGKVSYIDGNERKIFDFPAHNFTVAKGSSSAKVEKVAKPIESKKIEPVKEIVSTVEAVKEEKTAAKEEPKKEVEVVKVEAAKKVEEPVKVEIVKKEPAVEKVPTSAIPAATDGRMYKVQIGAFSAKPKIDGVTEISTLVLENGITKYFTGNFSNYDDAVKRKKAVSEKGFPGAFIVSFKDGKIVK